MHVYVYILYICVYICRCGSAWYVPSPSNTIRP